MKRLPFSAVLLALTLSIAGCCSSAPMLLNHSCVSISVSSIRNVVVFNGAGHGGEDLYVLDLISMRVERIAATPASERAPRLSTDGVSIVFSAQLPDEKGAHIFMISPEREYRQLTKGTGNDSAPCFSPDGRLVAFIRDSSRNIGGLAAPWGDNGAVWVVDLEDGTAQPITAVQRGIEGLCFNWESSEVIFWTGDDTFTVPVEGTPATVVRLPFHARDITFSADGRLMVYVRGDFSFDSEVFVRDVASGLERQLTSGSMGASHPCFLKTGDIIFLREAWPIGPRGSPKKSLWRIDAGGTEMKRIADEALFESPLQWGSRDQPLKIKRWLGVSPENSKQRSR